MLLMMLLAVVIVIHIRYFFPFQLLTSKSWKLYLALKRLVISCCKREYKPNDLEQLKTAIRHYLVCRINFRDYYEEKYGKRLDLTPKHGWVTHYARLVSEIGPLVCVDTNIGEIKNAFMKRASQKANQTKNVLKTIANRELFRFSVLELLDKSVLETKFKGTPIEEKKINDDFKAALESFRLPLSQVTFLKSVVMYGQTFSISNNSGVYYVSENETRFGKISGIVQVNGTTEVFLIIDKLSQRFLDKLFVWECSSTDVFELIDIQYISRFHMVNIYQLTNYKGATKAVVFE